MDNFEKHPAYNDDFKGNPETPKEETEAVEAAGISTHKEAMQRALELGLKEDDRILVEKVLEKLRAIEKEEKSKENLINPSVLLEKLEFFLKDAEALKKEMEKVEEDKKSLLELSEKMRGMELDVSEIMEKIKEKEDIKEKLQNIFKETESLLPYNRIDIEFATEYLEYLEEIDEKLRKEKNPEEREKIIEEMKNFPNKYREKETEMLERATEEYEGEKAWLGAADAYRKLGNREKEVEMLEKAAKKREKTRYWRGAVTLLAVPS